MMRWILERSMQLRLVLLAGAAVLLFFGVTELRHAPLDTVPEFSRPYVEIQTEALGLSAAEVESMITVPLEADMLNGVAWLDEIRSESVPGLSSIVMFFEPGTDLMVARQVVQERLVGVHALPNVSKPPVMLQPVSSTSRFLKIGLTSDTLSLIELSVLARWTIVPRLMGVDGVANVSIWGQRKRQLQVLVDPGKLRDEGVTLNEVVKTTGNALWVSPLTFLDASTPGTGGWIETPNQRLGLLHTSPIVSADDLAQVSVGGTVKRLGDIATVVENHQPLIGDALVDDEPALMLVVEKFPWTNTVEATRDVEAAIEALELGLPGVKLDPSLFRPATYLELARANLARGLLLGFALAAVGLFVLLGNWRTALIGLLAVVLSGLAAGSILYLRGVPINLMVIAGLMVAIALLIDDAIGDVQQIARRLRESRQANRVKSAARIIADAALELRSPIVYATLVVLLAVSPALFLGGVTGVFTGAIVSSYALALLVSIAVALTITPALCLLLLPAAARESRESPVLESLRGSLGGIVARAAHAPGSAFVAVVGIAGVAALVAPMLLAPLGESLLPQFQERDILVELEAAAGTSHEGMQRIATRASRELRAIPGVRNVSVHLGRAVLSDRTDDVDSSELWVSLERDVDFEPTLAAIREAMSGYPGFDVDSDTYLTERIRDEGEIDDPMIVRVYGEKMETILAKAAEIEKILSDVEGVEDPEIEIPRQQPSVEIEVDLARAEAYGLKPGDVRRALTMLLSGIEVGSLFDKQKIFDVVVWGTPEIRRNLDDIGELLIDTPPPSGLDENGRPYVLGGHVRVKEVADVRIVPASKVINREAVARHVDVTADISGRDFRAIAADVEARIRREVSFPLEYRAEVLGEYTARLATAERLRVLALGAALAIVLLLQAAFGSWRLAFGVAVALPLALVGGLLASLAAGSFFSLGSILGFVAVLGLAARHALVLIHHFRGLERAEGTDSVEERVRRGSAERAGPILATALVTALAVLPFALFGKAPGTEILYPMAIAILGGLVTSTAVSLLVIPSLYLAFGAGVRPENILEDDTEQAA